MTKKSQNAKPLFLFEAAWHFAPGEMQTAALRDQSKPTPKWRVKRFDSVDENVSQGLEQLGDLFARALSSKNPNEPSREMKANLIAGLLSEEFLAFGFMVKPRVGTKPQRIPMFIFDDRPKIDWGKNSIENLAHRFESIKIQRNVSARTHIELDIPSGVKGRPSVQADILEALNAACKTSKRFLTLKRKDQCQEIRRRLILFPGKLYDADYPADRTIKKAIPSGIASIQKSIS
jgi:hypothetical protein